MERRSKLTNQYSPFIRQLGLVNPRRLQFPIAIIGCGSIGSWTALGLGKMGCYNVSLFDGDTVEPHNLGSQLFTPDDIDIEKSLAVSAFLRGHIPNGELLKGRCVMEMWEPEKYPLDDYEVIISAVDSIEVRKTLYDHLKGKKKWFIDGRMGGNIITIYTFRTDNKDACASYEKTLWKTVARIPCSQKSVVYNAMICGGTITDIVAHIAHEKSIPFSLDIDLLNFEMISTPHGEAIL